MTCDDVQIAFEQQTAGVVAALSTAELDAHVSTCAACTAYIALSKELSDSLTMPTGDLPDVGAIASRAAGDARKLRRATIAIPLFVTAVLVALRLATVDVTPRALIGTLVGAAAGYAAGYIAFRWLLRRPIAELQGLDRAMPFDLIASWRRELDRRIRNERQAWWLGPTLLVAFHLIVAGIGVPPTPYLVFELACLAALAVILPVTVRRYRRLRRERELL